MFQFVSFFYGQVALKQEEPIDQAKQDADVRDRESDKSSTERNQDDESQSEKSFQHEDDNKSDSDKEESDDDDNKTKSSQSSVGSRRSSSSQKEEEERKEEEDRQQEDENRQNDFVMNETVDNLSYEEKVKKALKGDTDFHYPENVKIVRIFTSSTFTGI